MVLCAGNCMKRLNRHMGITFVTILAKATSGESSIFPWAEFFSDDVGGICPFHRNIGIGLLRFYRYSQTRSGHSLHLIQKQPAG